MRRIVFIILFMCILNACAQETIEFEIHNQKIDDKIMLNDFLLYDFLDNNWEVNCKLTNISSTYLNWVKLRCIFFKNSNLVDTQSFYLNFDTYGYYGLMPNSVGLITTGLMSKTDFDSINFVISYDTDSGLKPKFNEKALSIITTKFTDFGYSDTFSKWFGAVKNNSQTAIKFPDVFCCFFRNDSLLHIEHCFLDVQDFTINPNETGYFDGLLIVPANYDSVLYLTHYSIGLTGPVVTQIESIETPNSFRVSQNYPNPFNSSTTINYSIPAPGMLRISVFDVTGKLLFEENKNSVLPGDYSMNLNMSAYPSGTYFYRFTVNHLTSTHKMIYIK